MRKIVLLIAITLTTLVACERADALLSGGVSEKAKQALLTKYPNASDIVWHNKNGYVVATFSPMGVRSTDTNVHSAWFDPSGKWYMTEIDLLHEQLPEAVQLSFASTPYAKWQVKEVDKIEREGAETLFVIEVQEGTAQTMCLFFTLDGQLTKELTDVDDAYDYEDFIPAGQTATIESYIRTNFPSARILEVDREGQYIEVEILDGRIKRDLRFDSNSQWLHTKTELRVSEVPSFIMQTLKSSEYGSYRIDDVDQYVTLNKEYFRFELSSRLGDLKVQITKEGVLTVVGLEPDDDYPAGGVNDACTKFINTNYAGARIIEQEYNKGYLEVDIYHDGKEKTVRFNAANKWIDTHWDIRQNNLPQSVKNAIDGSAFASYTIDDVEFYQSTTADYYEVELEKGELEARMKIKADGTIL